MEPQNSNLISAIDSASKKTMKRHIKCPKVTLGKKVPLSPYEKLVEKNKSLFLKLCLTHLDELRGPATADNVHITVSSVPKE